ncbi:hypothetical protein CR513_39093, partial [Mucuna pruriens]
MEAPLPKGWRGVYLDKYNGVNPALVQLSTNSIDSFGTLKKKFDTQYLTSHSYHLTSMALVNLRLGDDKPFYSFMAQFLDVFVKIYNFNPEVALHSILMALKPRPFFDSLCRDSPTNMDDLRTRATNYIQMEEMAEYHDSDHENPGRANRKKGQNKGLTREPKYQVFTFPNTSRAILFEEACCIDLITLAPQHRLTHGANKTKYCCYHKNYDHTTKGCITLRDKIEELIQVGHLRKFVNRGADPEYSIQKQDSDNWRGGAVAKKRTDAEEQTLQCDRML